MIENDSYLGIVKNRLGWAPWDNCTAPAILDFPYPGRPSGVTGVCLAVVVLIYLYAILTAVCNFYLLPSLRTICNGIDIASDVAGATLMAAAASMPELALSVVGTYILESDIEAEAIVGSSIFNCLVIPALCALIFDANQEKPIHIWPLTRDVLMFCVSLICLVICINGDSIQWYEALLMVTVYIGYVLAGQKHYGTEPEWSSSCDEEEACDDCSSIDDNPICFECQEKLWYEKPVYWLFWPVSMLLKITIPLCVPWLAITISLIWIALVTYLTTWMIILIGYRLNIPDSLMSLTILGFGLGMPELLSSMNAAKRGKNTMALCNAMGANTFNILICLGLPWLLKLIFSDSHIIWINGAALSYNCAIILVIILILYTSLALNKFKLDKKIGCLFLILYSIFFVSSTLIELNVFSVVNQPMCNIKDYFND